MLPHRPVADVAVCAHYSHSAYPDSISEAALRRPGIMEWPNAGGMKQSSLVPVWYYESGASQILTVARSGQLLDPYIKPLASFGVVAHERVASLQPEPSPRFV